MNAKRRSVILFAEPAVSGHRLSYVRLLATEALRRGYVVHLALPAGGVSSPEYKTHIADLERDLAVETYNRFSLSALEDLAIQTGAHRTVVTDGDALALQIAKRGRWKGEGQLSLLIMREKAQADSVRVRMWVRERREAPCDTEGGVDSECKCRSPKVSDLGWNVTLPCRHRSRRT